MCGTQVPPWLARLFDGLDDLPGARQLVAATVAAELCRRLYAGGVRNFHFYTLNRAELAYAICHMLGMRAAAKAGTPYSVSPSAQTKGDTEYGVPGEAA